jgi:hypothetical protein
MCPYDGRSDNDICKQQCLKETTDMIPHNFKLAGVAAVSLLSVGFGAAPAAAWGCGDYGCGGNVVVVQPQPYVHQSCSCCGCGTSSNPYVFSPVHMYQPSYVYAGNGVDHYGPSYYRVYYRGGFRTQWWAR